MLSTGQAIVWTTTPYFSLNCRPCLSGEIGVNPFHPESPAGKLWLREPLFKNYWIEFQDPIRKGGFGGSTAEYLSLLQFQTDLHAQHLPMGAELIKQYHVDAYSGVGHAPSGVDLWAQAHGGLAFYDKSTSEVIDLPWQDSGVEALFVHTGHKLSTHEHLKAELKIPVVELQACLFAVKKAFEAGDLAELAAALNLNAKILAEAGLTCENSQQLKNKILAEDGVLAVKPCGAMGSDVIFVLVDKNAASSLLEKLKCDKNLSVFATSQNTAQGLHKEYSAVK